MAQTPPLSWASRGEGCRVVKRHYRGKIRIGRRVEPLWRVAPRESSGEGVGETHLASQQGLFKATGTGRGPSTASTCCACSPLPGTQ